MTRVIFMGTPEFAVPSLAGLLAESYDMVAVYTRPDQPAGRGQRLETSPVKQFALAQGLPLEQPRTLQTESAQATLAGFAPDVIVVAAFGLILPQAVLDLPRFGCINVHASVLPRHRGAAPIAAAILAGDVTTGVTIMLMDAGVDTGPALSAAYLPIAPEDTTGSLTAKLAELGAHQLLRTLPRWLAGNLPPILQLEEGATYAPRIEKEEGRIDWSETAVFIARKVRAFQPWPSAYTRWDGRMLKVLRAHAGPGQGVLTTVIPGDGRSAGVVTSDGVLWLDEVQLAGKKPAAIDAFLAGARGFVGSKLG